MRKGFKLSVGLACLVAMAAGGEALAKARHRTGGYAVEQNRDLSYNRGIEAGRGRAGLDQRSWLEPGNKVPVGTTDRYMLQQTFYNHDPIEANQRSWYMQETLPQRPPQNVIVPYDEGLPF